MSLETLILGGYDFLLAVCASTVAIFATFLNGMSYMPSCGVRRPSVRPSVCKHLRKSLFFLPDKWLDHDQTHSFANFPFPFPFSFLLHLHPQMAVTAL